MDLLKMFSLLKMGIFQPAILVYQSVSRVYPKAKKRHVHRDFPSHNRISRTGELGVHRPKLCGEYLDGGCAEESFSAKHR